MDQDYSYSSIETGSYHQPGSRTGGNKPGHRWSPENIARLMRDHPEYRLGDDPSFLQLVQMAVADPDDFDVQEMLNERIQNYKMASLTSGDAFYGNYPTPGGLTYLGDFLSAGQMPTGDAIGLLIRQLPGNVGVLGPTRSGKTNLLANLLVSSPLLMQTTCVIVFVKKPELRHLMTVQQIADRILVLRKEDLALSLVEPPDDAPEQAWNNESVRLIAQCYARLSSQRLLGDTVNHLMKRHPQGIYPTLRQVTQVIEELKPRWGSREALYRESILWVLRDLLNCTGNMWDHSSSTLLKVLTNQPGLTIIELPDLPQEHFTFIVTYFARWAYFKRLYGSDAII